MKQGEIWVGNEIPFIIIITEVNDVDQYVKFQYIDNYGDDLYRLDRIQTMMEKEVVERMFRLYTYERDVKIIKMQLI